MIIIGADYHPGFQQIAFVDTETGEFQERRLEHREEAEKFYRDLKARGTSVRVGWKPAGMLAGLSGCSPSYSLSCGSWTRPRSERSGCASKRRIAKMHS